MTDRESTPSSSRSRGGSRVQVAVCDAHEMFRHAVVQALKTRPEFQVVGVVGDFVTLLALDSRRIDVLVADMESLNVDIDDLTAWAQASTRILCLSESAPSERIYRALSLGATSYLDKICSEQELCDAVAATARGESRIGSGVQVALAQALRRRHTDGRDVWLTPREREIILLMCEGLLAPEIAVALCVSTTTVKKHQQTLYLKLGVNERAAAVAKAFRLKLIE
jgi:two-component system, NarL family, nitrate/nitrite response regulator NarL